MKETFGDSGGEGGGEIIPARLGSYLKFAPWWGYGYFLGLHIPDHVQLILQPYTRLDTENSYPIPHWLFLEVYHYTGKWF